MTNIVDIFATTRIKSANIKKLAEKEFMAKIQENSAKIRECLKICNIHGCYKPEFVRKEVSEYLRDNFVYQVDLETFMKYIWKFCILKEEWPVGDQAAT